MNKNLIYKTRKEKGQGLVEFALVLPILLVIIFGLMEMGRLLLAYSSVTTASRQGARYGSTVGDNGSGTPRYLDCPGITAEALKAGRWGGLTAGDITITYYSASSGTRTCDTVAASDIGWGDRVEVRAVVTFETIVPLVGIPDIPIISSSSRTIFKNAKIVD